MRRQIKRVVATLLTASLIVPMCYGNKVSNAEMVKKNVTATAVDEDGSDGLTEITELHAASVDNKIEVRIWKNDGGKNFLFCIPEWTCYVEMRTTWHCGEKC